MKIMKKVIALLAVASMSLSLVTTASASFSTITLAETEKTVEAGQTFDVFVTLDTLVGARAVDIKVRFDGDAFYGISDNDTTHNFGDKKEPKYYPQYFADEFLYHYNAKEGYDSILMKWPTISYAMNPTGNGNEMGIGAIFFEGNNKVTITSEDEADDMYPYKGFGVRLIAADDIAPGEYPIYVDVVVSDATVGDISKTVTMIVKVEGDGPTAEPMNAGVLVKDGVYAGKTSASTDVVAAKDLVKVVISNDVDTSKTLTWEAPKTYGEGKQNVLAVLLYDAADETLAGSTFTVKFLSADAVIKTFTHKVQ